MSEPNFFQTRMGHAFYEHDVPELIRAINRLAEAVETLNKKEEHKDGPNQVVEEDLLKTGKGDME